MSNEKKEKQKSISDLIKERNQELESLMDSMGTAETPKKKPKKKSFLNPEGK